MTVYDKLNKENVQKYFHTKAEIKLLASAWVQAEKRRKRQNYIEIGLAILNGLAYLDSIRTGQCTIFHIVCAVWLVYFTIAVMYRHWIKGDNYKIILERDVETDRILRLRVW